jgi:hypothetical protein
MLMILRFQNGMRVNAILLTASHDLIRVVIPNCTDTIEFRLKKRRWISDEGCVAEIEAVAGAAEPNTVPFVPRVRHAA